LHILATLCLREDGSIYMVFYILYNPVVIERFDIVRFGSCLLTVVGNCNFLSNNSARSVFAGEYMSRMFSGKRGIWCDLCVC